MTDDLDDLFWQKWRDRCAALTPGEIEGVAGFPTFSLDAGLSTEGVCRRKRQEKAAAFFAECIRDNPDLLVPILLDLLAGPIGELVGELLSERLGKNCG